MSGKYQVRLLWVVPRHLFEDRRVRFLSSL